jgi:hypothetical protein
MDETGSTYAAAGDDSSAWDRIERTRDLQRWRVLCITLGDAYLGAARGFVGLSGRHIPRAVGLLVKAAAQYQAGGLTRQGRSAWRYARMLHRLRSAGVGR